MAERDRRRQKRKERPPQQSIEKAQVTVESRAKRSFTLSLRDRLTMGVAIGGALAIASVAGFCLNSQPQQVPNLTDQEIVTELKGLNQDLGNADNDQTTAILGRSFELATIFFCKEVSCSPDQYQSFKGSMILQDKDTFFKEASEKVTCKGQIVDPNTTAYTDPFLKKTYFNRETNNDPAGAELLFGDGLHELYHLKAPLLQLNNDGKREPYQPNATTHPIALVHGVKRQILQPEKNLPGKVCYGVYRQPLDEAIVEHSASLGTQRLGIKKRLAYTSEVENYTELVRYHYARDHRILLGLQQQSRDEDFIRNVGAKLGYSPAEQLGQGDIFLAEYFNPIRSN